MTSQTGGERRSPGFRSAAADLYWAKWQPPGRLIRSLIRDWPRAERARLPGLLELKDSEFDKILIGARALTPAQAKTLAMLTGAGEAVLLEMEEGFDSWRRQTVGPTGTGGSDGTIMFAAEEIGRRVAALALEMAPLAGKDCVLVAILKGGFVFTADLIRFLYRLEIDAALGFIELKTYGSSRVSKPQVEIVTDIDAGLVEDKTVLIVDDVYDSGKTLDFAVSLVRGHGARQTLSCVLVEKLSAGGRDATCRAPDHVGFRVREDGWLVGYGMDDNEGLRGSPDILVRPNAGR